MSVLEYMLFGRPVPWQRARSQGRRRWTDPVMRDAQNAHRFYANCALGSSRAEWPMDARYELHVIAYVHPQQRGDADNIVKLVADALQGVLYTNDRQLVSVTVERRTDRDNPRTHVRVVRLEKEPAARTRSATSAHPPAISPAGNGASARVASRATSKPLVLPRQAAYRGKGDQP